MVNNKADGTINMFVALFVIYMLIPVVSQLRAAILESLGGTTLAHTGGNNTSKKGGGGGSGSGGAGDRMVRCPNGCGASLKAENLQTHLEKCLGKKK